jgi:polyphosphate kinase 2 (PPK2 family)
LHISKKEQAERLIARLDDPEKRWKFDAQDIVERGMWDDYREAYEDAIEHCLGWFVVPADHKWYRNWAVAKILIETLEEMRPEFPRPDLDIEGLKKRISET